MAKYFTREEIWKLESRIRKEKEGVSNPHWIRMYEELEHSLSTFDAFLARSSVPSAPQIASV